MRNKESESGFNFTLIMPVALLLVLLVVPFSINSFMHFVSGKRPSDPVIMRVPIDSTAITIPSQIKQYEPFEVVLNLETKQLANFLNDIVANASEGTAIQGITGVISASMKAEMVGTHFKIDQQGPQEPLSSYKGTSQWKWQVTPESSGAQELKFRLHLLTHDNARQYTQLLAFAEAKLAVQGNSSEWLNRHWHWIVALLLIPVAVLGWKRRFHR